MDYINITCILNSYTGVNLDDLTYSNVRKALIYEIGDMYCNKQTMNCETCNCGTKCLNKVLFYTSNENNLIEINAKAKSNRQIALDIKLFGNGMSSAKTIMEILRKGILLGEEEVLFSGGLIYTLDEDGVKTPWINILKTKET